MSTCPRVPRFMQLVHFWDLGIFNMPKKTVKEISQADLLSERKSWFCFVLEIIQFILLKGRHTCIRLREKSVNRAPLFTLCVIPDKGRQCKVKMPKLICVEFNTQLNLPTKSFDLAHYNLNSTIKAASRLQLTHH